MEKYTAVSVVLIGYLFLYKEAALMFKEAYSICEEEDMLKAYIYCCYRGLPEKD